MTVDLTKITTRLDLLDDETRKALEAHGGPWETWSGARHGWITTHQPAWFDHCVYRVKSQPPKPREWWLCGGYIHHTKDNAEDWARSHRGEAEIIHVREVLK